MASIRSSCGLFRCGLQLPNVGSGNGPSICLLRKVSVLVGYLVDTTALPLLCYASGTAKRIAVDNYHLWRPPFSYRADVASNQADRTT
jgi:hypothetical protein